MPRNLSRGIAALETMVAGDGKVWLPENRVDVVDPSAADESERAAGGLVQVTNELVKIVLEPDLRRRRREIGERAVDVEEVRPANVGSRQASGARRRATSAARTKLTIIPARPPNGSFHFGRREYRRAAPLARQHPPAGSTS